MTTLISLSTAYQAVLRLLSLLSGRSKDWGVSDNFQFNFNFLPTQIPEQLMFITIPKTSSAILPFIISDCTN